MSWRVIKWSNYSGGPAGCHSSVRPCVTELQLDMLVKVPNYKGDLHLSQGPHTIRHHSRAIILLTGLSIFKKVWAIFLRPQRHN